MLTQEFVLSCRNIPEVQVPLPDLPEILTSSDSSLVRSSGRGEHRPQQGTNERRAPRQHGQNFNHQQNSQHPHGQHQASSSLTTVTSPSDTPAGRGLDAFALGDIREAEKLMEQGYTMKELKKSKQTGIAPVQSTQSSFFVEEEEGDEEVPRWKKNVGRSTQPSFSPPPPPAASVGPQSTSAGALLNLLAKQPQTKSVAVSDLFSMAQGRGDLPKMPANKKAPGPPSNPPPLLSPGELQRRELEKRKQQLPQVQETANALLALLQQQKQPFSQPQGSPPPPPAVAPPPPAPSVAPPAAPLTSPSGAAQVGECQQS
jgi:hypothetical protein